MGTRGGKTHLCGTAGSRQMRTFEENVSMNVNDIIEAIVDELVMSDLADDIPSIHVERTGPGSLLLNYGSAGRFTLTVAPEPDPL
jgi:hypothetical protein